MSNQAAFLSGDFNLSALDNDTNKIVNKIFNLVFQNGYLALIQKPISLRK